MGRSVLDNFSEGRIIQIDYAGRNSVFSLNLPMPEFKIAEHRKQDRHAVSLRRRRAIDSVFINGQK